LLAALTPSTAGAAGQTYTVVQCHPLNRARANAILEDAPPYAARSFCGDPQNDYAIKVTSTRYSRHGGYGRVRWTTGSSALGIVSVELRAKLRRDNGHAARLWMADPHLNEVAPVAGGHAHATAYRHYSWDARGHGPRQFVASLRCERADGCKQSHLAKTWVRAIRFKVADYSAPGFSALNGTLLSGGWLRGAQSVHAQANDLGSGLETLAVTVNGVQLAAQNGTCEGIPGTAYAARIAVCGADVFVSEGPATSEPPFHDGQNSVSVCAVDFAGNRTCEERSVRVDNTPPAIAFTASQEVDDPELIRAPVADTTSGVWSGQIFYRPFGQTSWRPLDTVLQSGELRARVDSTIDPPGEYEFMAQASDVAGNSAQTTSRADGQPMRLTFPLKSGVKLNAHLAPGGSRQMTVAYGQVAKVAGRLRDASGKPLPNQRVTVTEYFGAGALIDRRVRIVQTDSDGLWGERLPAGPSRTVSATYDGTRRYLADGAKAGRLRVKTRATFHLSRPRVPEGRRVVFRGRVGHLAARIPAGGKLIELQVKDGSQWHTVRQAFYTRPDGHYRMRYRFARFYTSNVAYRFRVKVLRESGWPYKAPVSSRAKRLVVKAR
jgi:hypothetical protein